MFETLSCAPLLVSLLVGEIPSPVHCSCSSTSCSVFSAMFKKKPQIKNLAPLRSSDRRRLADQIIADCHVPIPTSFSSASDDADPTAPPQASSPSEPSKAPILTSIRASLIPESCLSARFTTHAGATATLVSGTVYVGAHPGQEERILWIQYGKDPRLYPTVYSCWQNPGLVPLLHTQDFVVEKLQTGADLMTPGLAGGPPWPTNAKQGAVVAVAGLGRESVPVCVGVCKIDVSALGRVQGLKGPAVEGLHWVGDEIWSWSQTGNGGRKPPDRIEGWQEKTSDVEDGVGELDINDDDDDDDEDDMQEDGGVALEAPALEVRNGHAPSEQAQEAGDSDGDEPPDREPTASEVDEAFFEAFLYAVYKAKKSGSPPHYGIDFPILPSLLISHMVQPNLRVQNPHYTIKKTSWKNVKKFIKHLDKQVLVKSKDRQGGETVILDIDFNDQRITGFTPYRLPKPKPTATSENDSASAASSLETSLNQTLHLLTLYRASSKLVPNLIPSKTTYFTSHQISNFIKTYIANNPSLTLPSAVTSKRFIKLDPFLANNILSSTTPSDTKALAAGEVARDYLQRRILDDSHLCIPHWILIRNPTSSFSPSTPDFDAQDFLSQNPSLKPKLYPSPRVHLILEKRTGTKTVTKISGLETFHINPNTFGPELARKCAGSASVGQHVGGKPGMMEVVVQGDQRETVTKEVGRRGVKAEWVEVVDKSGKGKKKK